MWITAVQSSASWRTICGDEALRHFPGHWLCSQSNDELRGKVTTFSGGRRRHLMQSQIEFEGLYEQQ